MTTRDKNIVGEVLAKTYRIERFLGAGTVGTVYVARHVRSGGLYAVKVLHRRLAASADVYQRFQDEARLVATLRHPHILPITDFDRDDSGVPFFVMDLLEGESLAQRLKHRDTLPFAQVMELLSQVGSALHAAHRSGIVHRNLRPENIFLVRHDLGDRVVETTKVTDFGLACFRRPPGSSREVPPTVYNAPEQFQEGAAIDGRVDQWALAALTYRLLSGKSPFEEGTPEELLERITSEAPRPLGRLLPDLPPHVVAAIHRGMARRREDRYETTLDFVRAISHKNASAGVPAVGGEAVPENLVARAVPPSGRIIAPPPTPPAPVEIKAPAPPPAVPTPRVKPQPAPIPTLAAPPMLFEKTPPPMQVPRQSSQLPVILGGGAVVLVLLTLIVIVAVRRPASQPQPVAVPQPTAPIVPPVVSAIVPDLSAPVVVAQTPDAGLIVSPPVVRDVGLQLRGAEVPSDSAAAAVGAILPVAAPVKPGAVPGTPAATGTTLVAAPAAPTRPPGTPTTPSPATPTSANAANRPAGQAPTTPPGGTTTTEPPRPAVATGQPTTPAPTGTGEPAAPPEIKPSEPVRPSAPAEKTPDEIMSEAKKVYVTGEKERAVELALQAAEKPGPHVIDSWRFVGSAACSIHNSQIASRAYAHLASAEHKQLLAELCQRNGLVLQNGQFITVE